MYCMEFDRLRDRSGSFLHASGQRWERVGRWVWETDRCRTVHSRWGRKLGEGGIQ